LATTRQKRELALTLSIVLPILLNFIYFWVGKCFHLGHDSISLLKAWIILGYFTKSIIQYAQNLNEVKHVTLGLLGRGGRVQLPMYYWNVCWLVNFRSTVCPLAPCNRTCNPSYHHVWVGKIVYALCRDRCGSSIWWIQGLQISLWPNLTSFSQSINNISNWKHCCGLHTKWRTRKEQMHLVHWHPQTLTIHVYSISSHFSHSQRLIEVI
jgi:hypothetical protein